MNDGRADRDALRAKRAAEDYERAWRAKERAEAEKKAAMLADILQSRKDMAEKKQHVLSQAAQMEKEQFQRILQVQREQVCLSVDPFPTLSLSPPPFPSPVSLSEIVCCAFDAVIGSDWLKAGPVPLLQLTSVPGCGFLCVRVCVLATAARSG